MPAVSRRKTIIDRHLGEMATASEVTGFSHTWAATLINSGMIFTTYYRLLNEYLDVCSSAMALAVEFRSLLRKIAVTLVSRLPSLKLQ
jgi:hypothetical protein